MIPQELPPPVKPCRCRGRQSKRLKTTRLSFVQKLQAFVRPNETSQDDLERSLPLVLSIEKQLPLRAADEIRCAQMQDAGSLHLDTATPASRCQTASRAVAARPPP